MPLLMCDLDDTLVERAPVFRAWAERFLAEQGAGPDAGPDAGQDLVEWLVAQDRGGHRPRAELWELVRDRLGFAGTAEEFDELEAAQVGGAYRLTDGVREALDRARAAGWSVAVVTNGPVWRQQQKITATGLDTMADAVCISGEVGRHKPDASMFTTAAERAGTTLAGAWMIGDNLDADIAGARGVGVRSVWIDRGQQWVEFTSRAEPDLVAADLPDAVDQVLRGTG